MAKAKRNQKLKVFRMPIGFHDAFVAAPSQRAALEAWGADSNLFAQGIAEQVTEPGLVKVPLANPGQVVKVARGSRAEQIAALGRQAPPRARAAKSEVLPAKRAPKPDRKPLERAEQALEKLRLRQAKETQALERERKELDRRISELNRRHERECDEAQELIADARSSYERAVRRHQAS